VTLYVDSSALLKRYVDEHDSAVDVRQAQAGRAIGLHVIGV
jgi:predicted nucleic acid-binding protein